MKFIFIFTFALLIFGAASAQNGSTFTVEYLTKQRTMFADSVKNQKVEGKIIYTDSNNVTQSITSPVSFRLPDIELEAIFSIIADNESSKMFFGSIEQQKTNIGVVVNTPDTIFYSKGNWTRLYDGVLEPIEGQSFQVKETQETKLILGYKCIKFVSPDEDLIFWACKDLPNTLLPYTGLQQFKYAILEIQRGIDNLHTIATEITKD